MNAGLILPARSCGMQVYISGSLAFDRIMSFPGRFVDHILPDKIHILNVCFTVNGLKEHFGGTAGNIAYSLALLEERPMILASVGKDFGDYEAWLKKNTLSVSGIRVIPEECTACAYITTDLSDNQITGFNPGAMNYPSNYRLDNADPKNSLAIIAPGNLEDMTTYPKIFKKLRVPCIIDPGQSIPALSRSQLTEMIAGSFLLVSNDYELELIKKSTGWSQQQLLSQTGAIITTRGEKGSLVCANGAETTIPAVRPTVVLDPTGAGDAFRAGLIKGLILGKDLIESACLGATCASYAVACKGTQEHHFTLQEFWDRHHGNFNTGSNLKNSN